MPHEISLRVGYLIFDKKGPRRIDKACHMGDFLYLLLILVPLWSPVCSLRNGVLLKNAVFWDVMP
jgi:hypothetical protein